MSELITERSGAHPAGPIESPSQEKCIDCRHVFGIG